MTTFVTGSTDLDQAVLRRHCQTLWSAASGRVELVGLTATYWRFSRCDGDFLRRSVGNAASCSDQGGRYVSGSSARSLRALVTRMRGKPRSSGSNVRRRRR